MRLPMSNQNTELAESLQNYTLQIYFVQGMKAIMANKPSYSGILVSLSIGGTSTRVIGVNPSYVLQSETLYWLSDSFMKRTGFKYLKMLDLD